MNTEIEFLENERIAITNRLAENFQKLCECYAQEFRRMNGFGQGDLVRVNLDGKDYKGFVCLEFSRPCATVMNTRLSVLRKDGTVGSTLRYIWPSDFYKVIVEKANV